MTAEDRRLIEDYLSIAAGNRNTVHPTRQKV